MTRNSLLSHHHLHRSLPRRLPRLGTALLLTASGLALASAPAAAQEVIFSDNGTATVTPGVPVVQTSGLTQVRMPNGAMLSFTGSAEYTINADGSITLTSGSVTVAGADDSEVAVKMPDGAVAHVRGATTAGVFTVTPEGQSTGHTLTGVIEVTRGRSSNDFEDGQHWESVGRRGTRRTMANAPQPTPPANLAASEPQVEPIEDGGPVAAAANGLPVSLGDALAAAGAASDIVAAARRVELAAGNPDIDTFPSGDLALLVAAASRLEGLNGGTPFPQAQADIIATYLGFLADGGSGAQFLTAYAGFLDQYLALVRSGALPSSFDAAGVADIHAFLAFQSRRGALGDLAAQDRVLAEAYLAFLAGGGNIDLFSAQFTDLIESYFAFVRAGGDPADFTGGSTALIDQYVAFLNDSGLLVQLSQQNQALLAAYVANGGIGFAGDYRAALEAYYAFLEQGGLPSGYTEVDLPTLQAYIAALQAAGLLGLLGDEADFYADYLAYLQGGGNPDTFIGLPASNLPLFADALNAYAAFLAAGGLPSDFTATDLDLLATYVEALRNAGQLQALLGNNAALLDAYFAYLATGANADLFSGLPIYADYVAALNAYFAFLDAGGLPADYTVLTPQQVQDYLAALAAAGGLNLQLGNLAAFYTQYFAFISAGGDPVNFSGLPIYADYVAALNAYFAFLANGGLPNDYTVLTQQQIEAYLAALAAAGGLDLQIGGNAATFFANYLAFIQGGGNPQEFAGLPVFADYLAAIEAYYAYLLGGGVPSGYTVLTQEQIQAYLAALSAAGLLTGTYSGDQLDFYLAYLAYLAGGGIPDSFGGLPGNTYVPPVQLAYQGGFSAANPRMRIFSGGTNANGGNSSASLSGVASSYSIDAQGRLTTIRRQQGESFTIGTASVVEVSGNDTFLIGRWTDGTFAYDGPIDIAFTSSANNGLNYLLVAPVANNFTMPASGTVLYDLAGATAPFYRSGSNPVGVYDASLGISFGSQLTFGIEGTLTMPRAGGADHVWTFSTPGGVQDPDGYVTAFSPASDANQFNFDVEAQVNQNICANFGGCFISHSIYFGGSDTDTVGAAYYTYGSDDDEVIVGNAIFAKSDVIPTPTPTPANSFVDSYSVYLRQAASLSFGTANATVAADGTISEQVYGNTSLTPAATATLADFGLVDDTVAFTSYIDRDGFYTNGNLLLLSGLPLTNLPASGTVFYRLLDGVAPMDQLGAAGNVGYFTNARLGVSFGAQTFVGMNFDVFSGDRGWHAQTAGGSDTPTNGGLLVSTSNGAFSGSLQTTGIAGDACAAQCSTNVYGALMGNGASHIGLTYIVNEPQTDQSIVQGLGVFGTSGTAIAGLGTMPTPTPTPTPTGGNPTSDFTGTRDNIAYFTFLDGSLAAGFGGSATLANGALTDFSSILGTISSNDTTIVDTGDVGDLAWARWTDGTVQDRGLFGNVDTAIGANGGYHVMAGSTTVTLPGSGTIAYELIGGTAPTDNAGSAPGTISGDLAIAFGTVSRVGYDLTMEVGGRSWTVGTNGGAADPTSSEINLVVSSGIWGFGGTFTSTSGNVTAAGGACAATCIVTIGGRMFGANADYAGVAMNVTDTSAQNGTIGASGIAIFGLESAATAHSPAGTNYTAVMADWARWDTSLTGNTAIPMADRGMSVAPGLDQSGDGFAVGGITYSADQLLLLENHLQRAAR